MNVKDLDSLVGKTIARIAIVKDARGYDGEAVDDRPYLDITFTDGTGITVVVGYVMVERIA